MPMVALVWPRLPKAPLAAVLAAVLWEVFFAVVGEIGHAAVVVACRCKAACLVLPGREGQDPGDRVDQGEVPAAPGQQVPAAAAAVAAAVARRHHQAAEPVRGRDLAGPVVRRRR